MPQMLNVTREALDAIRANSGPDFKSNAIKQKDGTYNLPLFDATVQRLCEEMLDGESWSDVIIRVCSTQKGKH